MLYTQGNNSGLQKLSIECKTCNVSESFYSSMSVKRFRMEHLDHDVVEGTSGAWSRTEPRGARHDGENVRLLKVLVELVMLPSYKSPVFTITGVKDDLKNAFVQVVSPSQRDQVRETLEKGKYLDSSASDTVYVWDPRSISFSEDANLAMRFGPSSEVPPEPVEREAREEAPRVEETRPSVEVQEIQVASGGEQSAVAISEVAPPQPEPPVILALPNSSGPALPLSPFDPVERSVEPPEPEAPADAKTILAPVGQAVESEPSSELQPPQGQVSQPEASESKTEVSGPSSGGPDQEKPEEEGSYLLVSKSWYVEKGPKNMNEAIRISKILRPFRWRIEPAYTISVVVDDILSIETANDEIGGDMTRQIEGAGYRLSRVSVEKGKPVAWFKREESGSKSP